MKVFGVGLTKTGTTTLGACFEHLGYDHFGWDRRFAEAVMRGDTDLALRVADAHETFDDVPWPTLVDLLDARYPDARFVLTVRRDADTWFRSLLRHAEYKGPTEVRRHHFGHTMPHGHRDEDIAFYEAHNRSVRERFAGRPGKLLEICWESEGDVAWERLCAFLGEAVPDAPVPHRNKRRPRTLKQYVRRAHYALRNRLVRATRNASGAHTGPPTAAEARPPRSGERDESG